MIRGLGSRCGWVIMVRLVHDTLLSAEMLAGKTVDEAAYHPGGSSNTPYHFMQLKPFPEKLQLTSLRRGANARNVSFRNSLQWPIYIINSVEKPNYLSLLIKVVLCL